MNDFEELQQNFTKQEKLALLRKIEEVKYEISEANLTKSGKNNFQKYHYFELKDFMPLVRKLVCKHGLATQFNVVSGKAYLNVFDLESGCFRRWSHELPVIKDSIQDKTGKEVELRETEQEKIKGALETYARRYLYLAFLELTDGDPIDSGDVSPQKSQQKKGGKKKYATPKELEKEVREALDKDFSVDEAEKLLQSWLKEDKTTEGIYKLTLQNIKRGE